MTTEMLPAVSADTAVWLYGSCARNDNDMLSDVDVLVVGSDFPGNIDLLLGRGPAAVSAYSWAEMEAMSASGSLFLEHLKREAKSIIEGRDVQGRLEQVLSKTAPYSRNRARLDVSAFTAAIADAVDSLNHGGSIRFELSVVATVVRHASILACYLRGTPCFSRFAPIARTADALAPQHRHVLERLCRHRRLRSAWHEPPTCDVMEAIALCDVAADYVERIREVL
jgi:hypothetical protein